MHTSAKVDSVSAPSNLTKGIAAIKAKNYQSAIECLLAEVKSIQLATKDAKGDIYKSLNPHYRLLSLAYAELAMQPAEDRIENLKRSIEMMNNVTPLAEADKARITLLQKTLDAVTQNQRLASQLLSMPSPSVEKKPDVGNKVKSSSNVPAPVKIKPKKKKVVFTKEPESSSTIDFSSKKELENIQSEKNKLEKEITRLFKEIEDNLKVIDAHSQSKYSKTTSGSMLSGTPSAPPLIKTGTILFAVLDTGVNSDYPDTPVLATIISGDYKGAKLLGKVQVGQGPNLDKVSLKFNLMDMQNWPATKTVNAFAIDPDTARTVMASNVDHHYMTRYGAVMATSFLSGYASAITQAGSTATTGVFGTTTTFPPLSPASKLAVGIGKIGTTLNDQMAKNINIPLTVTVNAGVGLGILFMSDVTQ